MEISEETEEPKIDFTAPHLDTDIDKIEESFKYTDAQGRMIDVTIEFLPNDCEKASNNLATLVQPITGIRVGDREKVRTMINTILGENKCCFSIRVIPRDIELKFTECEEVIGQMITEFVRAINEYPS